MAAVSDAGHALLIAAAVGAPFAAALVMLLTPARWAEAWSYLAAATVPICTALLVAPVRAGADVVLDAAPLAAGVRLFFRVDALGLTFGLLASGLWIITTLYSSGYVRASRLAHRRRYFAAFAASIGAAMGVAFAGNLLTFFLFFEGLTVATYPLVVHQETPAALAAGRRYLLYALGGGLLLLTAIAWTWALAGGAIDFVPGGVMHTLAAGPSLTVLFALFILGVAVKSAVMPLHAWLPAAMVAPTPVSALLHAVAVVKAGVFGSMRVLGFVFGPESLQGLAASAVLVGLCLVTIVIGSLIALAQDNLKRRLAYSTIVHLSYIVLGAALVAPSGLAGSVLHMVNHGLAKITLFFCAGAIYATAHVDRVSQLSGLGRRMPWTFGAFTVGALALVGLPGLAGFVSKLVLGRGAIERGDFLALAVMFGASLLTASYLLPIVQAAFFRRMPDDPAMPEPTREAPPAMLVPLLTTALLVIVFGLVPDAIGVQYELARAVASDVFGHP